MTDDEVLISSVKDKAQECEENAVITHTDFLDLKAQSDAAAVLNKMKNVRFIFTGGYDMAERKTVVFLPFYVDDFFDYIKESPELCPYVMLRADKDSFSKLTHRDYLGALMGLGIKREKIGDIIIDEKGCYFFADRKIKDYLCQNFTSAGRGTIKTYEATKNNELSICSNTEEKTCFVKSLRLDSTLSAVFSLSRAKASDFIEKGLVFVDDRQIIKPDYKLGEGNKLVLRGSGKAVIRDASSHSKSGRTVLIVDVFK